MQIAKIIPKVKTTGEGIFDYAISPEILPQIKIGVLVLIPFHGRKIFGIVINLKRSSKIESVLPVARKLKSIIKIVDPVPVVDGLRINLARWISEYYLTSYSQTIFSMLPDPAIRSINKDTITTKSARAEMVVNNNGNFKENNKPLLIVADFAKRMEFYRKIIDKTIIAKKSVIILVPDLSLIKYFNIKNIVIYHSNMTKSERWSTWNKIRSRNHPQIVIGSQGALFAPLSNLGLIIIDQEDSDTYKNYRSPRYHSVDTALALAKIINVKVILGSITPSINRMYLVNKNVAKLKIFKHINNNILISKISSQKKIIGQTLEEKIIETHENHKKIILFMDRKGDGSTLICNDCGWVYRCELCKLPLKITNNQALCYYCKKKYFLKDKCPQCASLSLKTVGITTGKINQELKKIIPKAKIIRIEKGIENDPLKYDWDIAIITSFAFKYIFPKIYLTGIINADLDISHPNYNSFEKSFNKNYKLLKMGKIGIIQTYNPESAYISSLAKMSIDDFYQFEIKNRTMFHYPPITKIIKLIYQDHEKQIAQNIATKKYNDMSRIFPKLEISKPNLTYINKKNNKWRYQILIKLEKKQNKELNCYIKNKFNNWTVDVDPVDLL